MFHAHLHFWPVSQGGVHPLCQLWAIAQSLLQSPYVGAHGEENGLGLRQAGNGLSFTPDVASLACACTSVPSGA